ncbi:hypothetical protein AVEN_49965-1 [Araneus ventricosus]|uniref:Uncharacterized protein n=1 Tax=Araneus ventricosus TaxID=182803 RepID=A0A4Y2WSS6_ARAVE|nr:hypothetical protein AVEN_49965-1 [Araneus ventricosus]
MSRPPCAILSSPTSSTTRMDNCRKANLRSSAKQTGRPRSSKRGGAAKRQKKAVRKRVDGLTMVWSCIMVEGGTARNYAGDTERVTPTTHLYTSAPSVVSLMSSSRRWQTTECVSIATCGPGIREKRKTTVVEHMPYLLRYHPPA